MSILTLNVLIIICMCNSITEFMTVQYQVPFLCVWSSFWEHRMHWYRTKFDHWFQSELADLWDFQRSKIWEYFWGEFEVHFLLWICCWNFACNIWRPIVDEKKINGHNIAGCMRWMITFSEILTIERIAMAHLWT